MLPSIADGDWVKQLLSPSGLNVHTFDRLLFTCVCERAVVRSAIKAHLQGPCNDADMGAEDWAELVGKAGCPSQKLQIAVPDKGTWFDGGLLSEEPASLPELLGGELAAEGVPVDVMQLAFVTCTCDQVCLYAHYQVHCMVCHEDESD